MAVSDCILDIICRVGQKVNPLLFLNKCATVCANKACFVSFECDTRNTTQAYNILNYY